MYPQADELLADIIEAINKEKAKDPPCGTALVINDKLFDKLKNEYSDLKDKLLGVEVLVNKEQTGFIVENWEWT
jgi:hypothetical protein